ALPEDRVFGLHKIPDLDSGTQVSSRAQIGERPDFYPVFQDALHYLGGKDPDFIADGAAFDTAHRTDHTAGTNPCPAREIGVGFDHGILPDFDIHLDVGVGGIGDRDSVQHQVGQQASAQDCGGFGQLHPVVDPQRVVEILGGKSLDLR